MMSYASTSVVRSRRRLQARMLLTLFLLGLVYAVLIGVLFALLSMGAREVSPQEAPELQLQGTA
jgi:hypothetical protein